VNLPTNKQLEVLAKLEDITEIRFEICDADETEDGRDDCDPSRFPSSIDFAHNAIAFMLGHGAGLVGNVSLVESYRADPDFQKPYSVPAYFHLGYIAGEKQAALADRDAKIKYLEALNETLAGSLKYIASGLAKDPREVARVALLAVAP
jgi:hypothetical protein